ncbi:MAG: hypothetical protein ACKVPX_15495, partial [Myxococcaceae bacterium]
SEVLEPMLVAVTQTRAGGYALVMFVYSLGLGIAFALLPRAGAVPKVLGLLGAAVCAMLFASTAGQIVAQEAFKLPVMVASSLLMLYQLGLALLMVRRTDGRGPAAHS